MAPTPLPPPPSPRASSERDARTQRRLDAARAARARRLHRTPAPTLRDRAAALRHRTRQYHTFLQVIALSALAGAPLTLIALPHLSAHLRMNQCQEMVQKMAIIEGRYMTSDEARLNCEVARDRGR